MKTLWEWVVDYIWWIVTFSIELALLCLFFANYPSPVYMQITVAFVLGFSASIVSEIIDTLIKRRKERRYELLQQADLDI